MRISALLILVALLMDSASARTAESTPAPLSITEQFALKLATHRYRSGIVQHNGTVNYAATDETSEGGRMKLGAPVVAGEYGPAVREVYVAVDLRKPLSVEANSKDPLQIAPVRIESPATVLPAKQILNTQLGGVVLRTGNTLPIKVISQIHLQNIQVVPKADPKNVQPKLVAPPK